MDQSMLLKLAGALAAVLLTVVGWVGSEVYNFARDNSNRITALETGMFERGREFTNRVSTLEGKTEHIQRLQQEFMRIWFAQHRDAIKPLGRPSVDGPGIDHAE